jgi:hypothetical protein
MELIGKNTNTYDKKNVYKNKNSFINKKLSTKLFSCTVIKLLLIYTLPF